MKKSIISNPGFLIAVFILALGTSKYLGPSMSFALVAFLLVLALIFVLIRSKISPVLFVAALGIFYFRLSDFILTPKPITTNCTEAAISSSVKASDGKLEFLSYDGSRSRFVTTVKSSGSFGYSDKIKLCALKAKADLPPSYSNYLKGRYRTDYLLEAGSIELVSSGRGVVRTLLNTADFFSSQSKALFGGDVGVLARGLVIGGSSDFSDNLKNALKSSGTSHLVAVSGYNVSIFAVMLFRLLRNWSRRSATITSFIALIAFCILSGATASVVRASIMAAAVIFARVIGRRQAALNSLLVAALVMVLINPYILWDVGFELSAAAMAGLILAEPLIKLSSFVVWQTLFETLAAQLATLPILLVNFGRISLVAPLTNILILPFVPLAMGLIASSIALFAAIKPIGLILGGITEVLLKYFLFVIEFFGALKFASFTTEKSWLGWLLYLPIGAIFYFIRKKTRKITQIVS